MKPTQIVIEDWDGDGGIRLPDALLQELSINVGDTLYLHTTSDGFVLSTRLKPHYRLEDLLAQGTPIQKLKGAIAQSTQPVSLEAMSPTTRQQTAKDE
jgi:antitoxin component of MazEF toxin-antitoxin module